MRDAEALAREWVEHDVQDPYTTGYVGTIIVGLLARIAMLREALRDTRHGYAPYGERRYDEITHLLHDPQNALTEKQGEGK